MAGDEPKPTLNYYQAENLGVIKLGATLIEREQSFIQVSLGPVDCDHAQKSHALLQNCPRSPVDLLNLDITAEEESEVSDERASGKIRTLGNVFGHGSSS